MMPGSDDYESEPLVEVAVPELVRESSQLRNEAPLNFVSLRSLVDGVGSGALSRVEMNALRAPLTALPSREDKCVFDEADDFIDSDNPCSRQFIPSFDARGVIMLCDRHALRPTNLPRFTAL